MYGELEKSNCNSIASFLWILHKNFSVESENVKKLLKMSKKKTLFILGLNQKTKTYKTFQLMVGNFSMF